MSRRRSIALALAVAVAVSGCVTAAPAETLLAAAAPEAGDPRAEPSPRLAEGIGRFGFAALRSVHEPGENAVVSPFSLESALSVAATGARGETAEEMAEVLSGSTRPEDLNGDWADLRASLMESEDATFTTADSIWIDEGFRVKKGFLDTNREYFGVETRHLDLQEPGAEKTVNDWVSDRTNGRIDRIVGSPAANAALLLVNATYFLADWESPFEHESTAPEEFTLHGGEKVRVETMHDFGSYDYHEDDRIQAVRLPYKAGRFAAYVAVPREGTSVEDTVDLLARDWTRLRPTGEARQGSIAIPRFELDTGVVDVTSDLKELGIRAAFDPERADFGGIADRDDTPLFISKVVHRVYLRVDEKGSEAAAATAIEMPTAAPPSEEPFDFRADRPFLFVIADEPSGAPLFTAVVSDPR